MSHSADYSFSCGHSATAPDTYIVAVVGGMSLKTFSKTLRETWVSQKTKNLNDAAE